MKKRMQVLGTPLLYYVVAIVADLILLIVVFGGAKDIFSSMIGLDNKPNLMMTQQPECGTESSSPLYSYYPYATSYIISLLFEADQTGPKTFVSNDGIDTQPLTSPDDCDIYTDIAFRDPRLIKIDNAYFLSYTKNIPRTNPNSSIGLAKSVNMRNWAGLPTPDWSTLFSGDENSIWNGAWFYDASSSLYYFYFATADWLNRADPYYTTFNPRDNTFSTPQKVNLDPSRKYADIMAVWKVNSIYYALLQSTGNLQKGNYVELMRTSSLSGTWSIIGANNFAGWGSDIEGGAEITLPNSATRVYFVTAGGGNVYYSDSYDLARWSKPVAIPEFVSDDVDWIDVVALKGVEINESSFAIQN